MDKKPDVICIQETWLKPALDFVIYGYESVRCDRERAAGGGCATFVKTGCQYMKMEVKVELECVVVRVREQNGWVNIVNYYNPCNTINVSELEEVMGQIGNAVIWVGDFNAHNPLWGSRIKDRNGCNVEEFIDRQGLVVLNDGRPTRFDIRTGAVSSIDLSLASGELARVARWEPMDKYTMGSDHFPILLKIGRNLVKEMVSGPSFFDFRKADWDKFRYGCDKSLGEVVEGTVDEWNDSLNAMVLRNAQECVPSKDTRAPKVSVPWWTKMCSEAVRERNSAYRLLRKYPIEDNVEKYKRLRAKARRVIKGAKRESWRKYCESLSMDTSVRKVWNAVHRMSGIKTCRKVPVLEENGVIATSDLEKAKMCEKAFKRVHSGLNLGVEGIRDRNESGGLHAYVLNGSEGNDEDVNMFFLWKNCVELSVRGKEQQLGRMGLDTSSISTWGS